MSEGTGTSGVARAASEVGVGEAGEEETAGVEDTEDATGDIEVAKGSLLVEQGGGSHGV